MTRSTIRRVVTPGRLLVYLGLFAHGHAAGHFANGNIYWGLLSALVGALAFLLAVIVAG